MTLPSDRPRTGRGGARTLRVLLFMTLLFLPLAHALAQPAGNAAGVTWQSEEETSAAKKKPDRIVFGPGPHAIGCPKEKTVHARLTMAQKSAKFRIPEGCYCRAAHILAVLLESMETWLKHLIENPTRETAASAKRSLAVLIALEKASFASYLVGKGPLQFMPPEFAEGPYGQRFQTFELVPPPVAEKPVAKIRQCVETKLLVRYFLKLIPVYRYIAERGASK